MHTLKFIVITGAIALAIALIAAILLGWENKGSKTIVLATAALLGTSAGFVIQSLFELERSTTSDEVVVEYTVNHATAAVGQFTYANSEREQSEVGASNWLQANDRDAFDRDGKVVASDLAIFSLISFLTLNEPDWRLRRSEFTSAVFPGFKWRKIEPPSAPQEHIVIGEAELRRLLVGAKNVFAHAPLIVATPQLWLPPKSTLRISSNLLVIRNPVCQVVWELQPPSSTYYVDPRQWKSAQTSPHPLVKTEEKIEKSMRILQPTLPSGKPKFETYARTLKVSVTYFALHSQRRDIGKYRDWVSRVLAGCHTWFEQDGGDIWQDNGVSQ